MAKVISSPLADISNLTCDLKNVKAKGRKGGRKRELLPKEPIPIEEDLQDKTMEESGDYEFFFRAKGNPIGSDHHALLVDCCFYEVKSPKPFRFEANWVSHENFLHIVKEGWNDVEGDMENKVLDLVRRLDACRCKLVAWSRGAFPNLNRLIGRLKQKLDCCNTSPLSERSVAEAEKLTRQLEEAWGQEEVYWWQRSRIMWLNSGDKNTRFFHSSVVQRRQRNKILRLKDDRGVWLEERVEINAAFNSFYQNLFSSVGPRPMEQALSYVNKVVTEEDNSNLMRPVTNQEIEEAVFQIGATKAPGPDGRREKGIDSKTDMQTTNLPDLIFDSLSVAMAIPALCLRPKVESPIIAASNLSCPKGGSLSHGSCRYPEKTKSTTQYNCPSAQSFCVRESEYPYLINRAMASQIVPTENLPFTVALGGFSLLLLIFFIGKINSFFKSRNSELPPVPEVKGRLPLIGNLLQLKEKKPYKTFTQWAEQYGPVYSVQTGASTLIVLNTADVAKERNNDPRSTVYTVGSFNLIILDQGCATRQR
ncbi:hypothetical protein K1719_015766 [Acacia pycnantha]|nr:hypothetical protein K1719_015766 [Acacia pycnantha]